MKILFGVQTEGNGHITQAIATKQYLQSQGIEVTTAFAAKKKRGLSKYFTDEFNVIEYDGFDFVFDNDGRVVIWKTIVKNTFELPRLIVSFIKICSIIQKEKPDAILPTVGGQTALNVAMDLDNQGILEKYNVELIGANKKAIEN